MHHKGALTGGYYDHRRSRLDAQQKIKELNEKIEALEKETRTISSELNTVSASIQRLSSTGADHDAVLQLTGVYHNLLRQWAES